MPESAVSWHRRQRYHGRGMKPAGHIVALRRDSNRIASAAEGRLDRIVPSCPGWLVADLVWHVGIVHMFWQMVARGALSGPEAWSEPDRPSNDDLLAWFRHGVDLTATILDGLDSDTPAWTWGRETPWASSGAEWPRKPACTAGMPSTPSESTSP